MSVFRKFACNAKEISPCYAIGRKCKIRVFPACFFRADNLLFLTSQETRFLTSGMVMDEKPILAYNEIDIFESDIELLENEYRNKLENPDFIYKVIVYKGLLEFIYKRLLKNIIKQSKGIEYDIELLDDIFYNIYLPLCYKYNISPTVLQFTSFCHIDYNNIHDLKNGIYRSGKNIVSFDKTLRVKKWYSVCESGLIDKAISESSIGSIFILKSVYKYKENDTLTIETNTEKISSPEEIKQRYENASIPEKPVLD